MPFARQEALNSLRSSGLPVTLVTAGKLNEFVLKSSPLHRNFYALSAIHRADYLRCYFMHQYGGAYSDIKFTSHSWTLAFDELKTSDRLVCGYREIGPKGVARVGGIKYIRMLIQHRRLLGNCAFICKPQTQFTKLWFGELHKRMDSLSVELERNPSAHPEDFKGKKGLPSHPKGSPYPVQWTHLMGDIFHPLCLEHHNHLMYSLPSPDFSRGVDA